MPLPVRVLAPGEVFSGRYKIVGLLGRGGSGSVYKAEQIFMKTACAVKLLDRIQGSEQAIVRFQKEAQAAGKLQHPNIVRALDFGVVDDVQPFLVMEFVQGQTLGDHLRKTGPMPVQNALNVFIPLCQALAYVHRAGVVHRDIKPDNIVLVSDQSASNTFIPKIIDFGMVRIEGEQGLTRTGDVFGTPLYMSPEQCSAARVDQRTDIYSLGCVLFEALTGGPPFRGKTANETIVQHCTSKPPTLKEASLGIEFPRALERIVGLMLAKAANDRYSSCDDVVQDLISLQQGKLEQITAFPSTQGQIVAPGVLPRSRQFVWGALACGIAVLLSVVTLTIVVVHSIESGSREVSPNPRAASNEIEIGHWQVRPGEGEQEDKQASKHIGEQKESQQANSQGDAQSDPMSQGMFYTGTNNGARKFNFGKLGLGRIVYWKDDASTVAEFAEASGEKSLPSSARLIFVPSAVALQSRSFLMSHFGSADLFGIKARNPTYKLYESDAGDSESSVETLTRLKGLRAVFIARSTVSDNVINNLSQLSHLTWLCLEGTGVTTEQLLRLRNISNLRVLALVQVDHIGPILQKLTFDKSMERLYLVDSILSLEDYRLISQMRGLKALGLLLTSTPTGKRSTIPGATHSGKQSAENSARDSALAIKSLEYVARLPNLERLCLDMSAVRVQDWDEAIASAKLHAGEMKNLRLLYIDCGYELFDRLKETFVKARPACTVRKLKEMDDVHGWFDPTSENPDKDGLW